MSIIERLDEHKDIPRSVLLKMEFQRIGVGFSDHALETMKGMPLNFKGEFMFSWDHVERKSLQHKIPFYYFFKRDDTAFQTRTNDNSPYIIDYTDGRFFVSEGDQFLEEVYFSEEPLYYSLKTSDGIPMSNIAQFLGKDNLFITINKNCEFWKEDLQCRFCDFGSVAKDQRKKGEIGTIFRTAEQIGETLEAAFAETRGCHLFFSGGTIVSPLWDMSELDYYCDLLSKVLKRTWTWYGSTIQISPPRDKEGWKKLHDTGLDAVQPNIEVWDRRLFEIICPGKAKYVGYDEWIRRMLEGVEVFGPGKIQPNFVIGMEMVKPWGFTDVDAAVESTLGGFEFLMQNGVFPRCAQWFIEPGSALAGQELPPLDYYIKFGKGYKELRHRYGFGDKLVSLCRGCNSQDVLHDWDYADYLERVKKARGNITSAT